MFRLKETCEKYLQNGKDLYMALMDLGKAYNKTDKKKGSRYCIFMGSVCTTESSEKLLHGK